MRVYQARAAGPRSTSASVLQRASVLELCSKCRAAGCASLRIYPATTMSAIPAARGAPPGRADGARMHGPGARLGAGARDDVRRRVQQLPRQRALHRKVRDDHAVARVLAPAPRMGNPRVRVPHSAASACTYASKSAAITPLRGCSHLGRMRTPQDQGYTECCEHFFTWAAALDHHGQGHGERCSRCAA